jgi:2-iminobutanoate/2-iminopropanoate deaminase
MMRYLLVPLMLLGCGWGAERRAVEPPGMRPSGPYSLGILTRDFLYVSGQGAKKADGRIPADVDGQLAQMFENVKNIVEAAGLTMEHVVYTQVYLTGSTDEGPLNKVWKEYFPKSPPARSTIGVAHLPGTPVEMSAVAVRDLSRKRVVVPLGYPASSPLSPGVVAADRMYLSGFLGRDINTGKVPDDPAAQVELSLNRMEATLKAAGLDFRHMVFVNPYLTSKIPMGVMNRAYAKRFESGNTPARATIEVAALPSGANMEFTGVAVLDLAKRRAIRPKNMQPSPTASPCVFAGDTLFCSAKSGFIPGVNGGIYAGTVETQMRQTMRNLLDGLEEAGMNFSHVAASNVYLDNVDEFTRMNAVYVEYFPKAPPARTTVKQTEPGKRETDSKGRWPTLEQVSIIAVQE